MSKLISQAIHKMSEERNDYGDIAKVVIDADHLNILNRIALTHSQFARQRKEAARAEKATGVRGVDPIAKPEKMISFIQRLMNNVCWAARRYQLAIADSDEVTNGIDFSQDVAEQVGLNVAAKNLTTEVDEAYLQLTNVLGHIAGKMTYLNDIDSLYYFAQNQEVDAADGGSTWVPRYQCLTYGDSEVAMAEVIQELEEKQEKDDRTEIANMDFTLVA